MCANKPGRMGLIFALCHTPLPWLVLILGTVCLGHPMASVPFACLTALLPLPAIPLLQLFFLRRQRDVVAGMKFSITALTFSALLLLLCPTFFRSMGTVMDWGYPAFRTEIFMTELSALYRLSLALLIPETLLALLTGVLWGGLVSSGPFSEKKH